MLAKGNEDRSCDHCDTVNVVSYTDYPERDKGELACASCGGLLINWKGTRDYHTAKIKVISNKGEDQ